ncbi:MAG: 2'-5' RNA ligase family protein [Burkholderiaceae bacterium]|nr:2'-5' RNA ligase family protein [Burkholderiaceae bacterium]
MQLSLEGLDAPATPTDRLFLALFPPPEVAQRIAAAWQLQRQALGLKGSLVDADRLHVTLMHLGDHPGLPPGLEASARQAAATLAGRPGFEVCFDRLDNFRKGRDGHIQVLVGSDGAAALQAFHRELSSALQRAGLARWMDKRPGFTPHVTLQYSPQAAPAQAVEPMRWRVQGFVLVNSKLGRHQHQHLAHWPLQA